MSWRNAIRPPQALATKLGVIVFVLLAGSSLAGFLFTYRVVLQRLGEMRDRQLTQGLHLYRDIYASEGVDAVEAALRSSLLHEGVEGAFFRILDDAGRERATSDMTLGECLNEKTNPGDFGDSQGPQFQSIVLPARSLRLRVVSARLGPGAIVQRGASLEDLAMTKQVLAELALPLGVLLLLAVLASLVLAWRVMSGVRAVTRTAAAISEGDLTQRVNIFGRGTEVDALATTFNTMLDQLEALVTSLREVTDDIAHDLRSPLTLMRGLAERFALSSVSPEEHKQISGAIVEGCDKLLNLINTILDISELNAGVANLEKEEFDLAGMVRDTCALFQPLAEDVGVGLSLGACAAAPFRGDKDKLHRALANLVDNAIKYTPQGGRVVVDVAHRDKDVAISVADSGVGIGEEDLAKIFERFYRPDHSRSYPGNGLGLSLSMATAKAHGGTITVESTLGKGSTLTLCLPGEEHAKTPQRAR